MWPEDLVIGHRYGIPEPLGRFCQKSELPAPRTVALSGVHCRKPISSPVPDAASQTPPSSEPPCQVHHFEVMGGPWERSRGLGMGNVFSRLAGGGGGC